MHSHAVFFLRVFFFPHPSIYTDINGINILTLRVLIAQFHLLFRPFFSSMAVCGSAELANVSWLFFILASSPHLVTCSLSFRRKCSAESTKCPSTPKPLPLLRSQPNLSVALCEGALTKSYDLRYDQAMIQKRVLNNNVRNAMIFYMTQYSQRANPHDLAIIC